MTLLAILAALFTALLLILPLLERHGPLMSAEKQQRLSRWILPLVGLTLVLALLKQFLG